MIFKISFQRDLREGGGSRGWVRFDCNPRNPADHAKVFHCYHSYHQVLDVLDHCQFLFSALAGTNLIQSTRSSPSFDVFTWNRFYSIILLLGSSFSFYLQSTQFSQTSGAKWKKLKELEPHEEARKKNGRSDYHITIISPMASNWSKHLGPHKNKVRQ